MQPAKTGQHCTHHNWATDLPLAVIKGPKRDIRCDDQKQEQEPIACSRCYGLCRGVCRLHRTLSN